VADERIVMSAIDITVRLLTVILFLVYQGIDTISNLTKNDPYPVYTTADPHWFLLQRARQEYKGYEMYGKPDWRPYNLLEKFQFSASGYRQSANYGRNVDCHIVPLGDLTGRWNVLGLFYPEADGNTDILDQLLDALDITDEEIEHCFNPAEGMVNLADPSQSDTRKEFGFFSVPIKYRKFGARFDIQFDLFCDFVFQVQGGVAELRQTASFLDLTCGATGLNCPVNGCQNLTPCPEGEEATCITNSCCIDIFTCDCKRLTIDKIMKEFECIITPTLNLCSANYYETAAEDTRFLLTWRRMFEINRNRPGWAHFLCMPWLTANVSAPTGKKVPANWLFALPTGNNGHWGYGFDAGIAMDFVETVEIAFEASMTRWSSRCYCFYPVPTNCLQSGVFPRQADVCIRPGTNWNFGATLGAYHFVDRLSVWIQYIIVSHQEDCFKRFITDGYPESNIDKMKLVENSKWEVQLFNVGFNYDISPNITLGALWQAPFKQRNAYRSTTVMGSLILVF
jgi:hypothetical protein